MIKIEEIKNLHVELTTKCQASCPFCHRNYNGHSVKKGFPITELTLSDYVEIVKPIIHNLDSVLFCGYFGDPMFANDVLPIIQHTLDANQSIKIMIKTNGSLRSTQWWKDLGSLSDRVWVTFDLDGLEDTHSIYRIGTDFNKIISNATAFINAGGNAIWQFIPFKHNIHQLIECQNMSKELGFKNFLVRTDDRDNGPVRHKDKYYNIKPSDYNGTDEDPKLEWERITQMHKSLQDKYDQDIPISNPHNPDIEWEKDESRSLNCDTKETSGIYIAANGEVYPCCYTAFYPKTFYRPGGPQLADFISNSNKSHNALLVGLDNAITWFQKIEDSWKYNTVNEGMTRICLANCYKCDHRKNKTERLI